MTITLAPRRAPVDIRTARQTARITQDQLANRLGVSARTVARWEAGTTQPSTAALCGIAAACHVDVDTLDDTIPAAATVTVHGTRHAIGVVRATADALGARIEEEGAA